MKKQENVDWHGIIQDILDEHLPLLSGKKISKQEREFQKFFKVDYYCETEGDLPKDNLLRPFDHLKKANILEYKSFREILSENVFRYYVARALFMESHYANLSLQGETTLTIITSRKPEKLFAIKEYAIEPINKWKYRSRFLKDLDIYFLVLRGARNELQGEALALLQVLEAEKNQQLKQWPKILSQDLPNTNVIQQIMLKINEENFMSFVKQITDKGRLEGKVEGKIEGRVEELLKVLGWISSALKEKYASQVQSAKTTEELALLEDKICQEIQDRKQTD